MVKSRIGPFALEAPLSKASRSGQVFRGIHLEQKKLAALRIFPIPMGLTPESREAYASQLEQLKQLRHAGVVRCYGGGFDTRNAYLAYQLVDGESLKSMIERRDRLPWETVLDYSNQLAEALQYVHQMGWVHGRLKPDKLLLAKDGTLKISDFRREAISSMIGGSADKDQLLFAAPEVLAGQSPDEKADLYSVGALMYYMLTGRPPFDAPESQIAQVVSVTPAPDVGTAVMDCPVWLSAIVAQLLGKESKDRPFSTQALLLAFKEAQKRQSQGVGVLQHATAGFSPLQLKADRDEAEKVLGIKPKKKKKKKDDASFFDQTWVLLVGLVAAIGAVVWFMLPLSEESLRERAVALLPPTTDEWQDWNRARDVYLRQLLDRFPDGQNSEWAGEQLAWVNAREHERRLERDNRLNRRSKWKDADRQYWAAREFEEFGDLLSAVDKYRAVKSVYSEEDEQAPVVYLAEEGLARIAEKGRSGSKLQDLVARKLEEAEKAYDQARILEAREIWESIIELYSTNDELAPQVTQAQERVDELKRR